MYTDEDGTVYFKKSKKFMEYLNETIGKEDE